MEPSPLNAAQLAALRDLAAFYRAVVATEHQDHPLISLWDAFDDPVAELRQIIARHREAFALPFDSADIFADRDDETLRTSSFETLARLLKGEIEWAAEIHDPKGFQVCGFETAQNADRLFSIVARAAQMTAEADDDPDAFPPTIFHDHPFIIFLRG